MEKSENNVPLHPMVLLIIIPFLNGYFVGGIPPFQTYPNGKIIILVCRWWILSLPGLITQWYLRHFCCGECLDLLFVFGPSTMDHDSRMTVKDKIYGSYARFKYPSSLTIGPSIMKYHLIIWFMMFIKIIEHY